TNECELYKADPEGTCCLIMGSQCRQIVINRGFEDISGAFPTAWSPVIHRVRGTPVGVTEFPTDHLWLNYSMVAFTDSVEVTDIGFVALRQDLSSRNARISDFRRGVRPIEDWKAVPYMSYSNNNQQPVPNSLSFDSPEQLFQTIGSSLQWKVYYEMQYFYATGCGFEIVVRGKMGQDVKSLHYYYVVNSSAQGCQPQDTVADKYIFKQTPAEMTWLSDSANIYSDWVAAGWSTDYIVSELSLVSHGVRLFDSWTPNAQLVRWDDIKLTKESGGVIPPTICEARGKRCCDIGAGAGDYFGLQLTCPLGKECWSDCALSTSYSLSNFIRDSNNDDKKNMSTGFFQYIKDPSEQTTEELESIPRRCEGSECNLFDYGSGYAACLDTSDNAPRSCRNWNDKKNTYKLNLDDTSLRTPTENGTYELVIRVQYKPTSLGNCGQILDPETNQYVPIPTCVMYEAKQQFTVGASCTPSWQCGNWTPYPCTGIKQTRNCTDTLCGQGTKTFERNCCTENWQCGDWSTECIGGMRTRTCTDLNNCNTTYNLNNTWADPSCLGPAPCTEADWSCTEWTPSICPREGYQTRTCDLIAACDEATGYVPEESRSCMPVEEKPSLGWLIYVLIGIIVVAVVIFVILKFAVPKGPAKPKAAGAPKETYPELASYIKDALATGATRQDVMIKLKEAGWPKEAIETAFKEAEKPQK
ncbi:MAG: hypothetical protein K6T73_07730, partial [Candidatus Bathyarchaeota archaeon]|nr:hypothetical protein [Candidatus Bathyarchaeota archaeon]